MIKNPSCNEVAGGLIPGQGTKIPHAAEQLSQCTVTESCMPQLRSCMLPLRQHNRTNNFLRKTVKILSESNSLSPNLFRSGWYSMLFPLSQGIVSILALTFQ